jgi:hypothetical protein
MKSLALYPNNHYKNWSNPETQSVRKKKNQAPGIGILIGIVIGIIWEYPGI